MVAATKPTSLRDSLFTPEALGQQPLPPSERDFEVFETLTFHGENTRSTAELFGISQTRVLQIRDRVADWLGSCGPVMTRLPPEQRVHLAARMAELRLDFLYC